MDGRRALVIDDEVHFRYFLRVLLEKAGFAVKMARNGIEALDVLRSWRPDVITLDVMMPELDGIAATAAIRRESNAPIILLTAKSESSDKVLGLNVGADDYITKPFDPVEVLARVKSQLRRYTLLGAKPETAPERGIYTVGGVTLNEDAKSVTVDGESVSLTPLEFNILQLLIRSPGRIYSSSQIYELVWNENSLGAETSVAVHIRHLRQKIEINPSEPRYLKVVWGLGYKMEDLRHEKE